MVDSHTTCTSIIIIIIIAMQKCIVTAYKMHLHQSLEMISSGYRIDYDYYYYDYDYLLLFIISLLLIIIMCVLLTSI